MTGLKTPKVRFVKCPKCWNVLPESVDVPVYRCGGCGTILQAKYRQQDAERKLSGLHGEGDDVGDRASDSKGSSTSEEDLSSSLEHPSDDLNNVKDMEQDNDFHLEDELNMPCPDVSDRSQDITYGDQNNGRIEGETGESNKERQGSNEVTEIDSCAEANSLVREGLVGEEFNDGDLNHGVGISTNESSPNVVSQFDEQAESEEQIVDSPLLERVMSANTCASTEYLDTCSTFCGMLSETCKSPTNRSFHHGYDASVSSFDTPEDRFLYNQKPLPVKMKHPRRDKNGLFLPDDHRRFKRSYELPPRVPLYQNMPRKSGYDEEGSSKQVPKNFRQSKSISYQERASPEYINEEKIKLLRMVYELEEQLKKTCNLQGVKNSQKRRPTSHSHELFLEPQRHWGHHNLRSSSRIPFSAEVARADPFPLPRDRQRSEPLPPPPYKSIRRSGTGQSSFVNSYSSWPSSPVQYVDEFPPWEGEEEDRSYEFQNKLKKRLRERSHDLNKKHLRPIARAAPFIACQNCSEFLQLPEDFLLSERRCHRVRCGSCSTVMKFSLENRTCLVPYEEDFRGPPPSEAEEYGESMNMMMTSTSNGLREDSKGKVGYSEIEEMPRRLGSPLHQLLGYSTLSQVFKGFGPSSSGASSSMQRTSRR